MDWGAWWATVQRVAKSRRGLSSYAYTHLIILHSLSFYRIVVHIIIVNTFIFKVFIEFVTILPLFHVLVFWPRGMWDLSCRPGIKPAPPALGGKSSCKISTPGPPGTSLALSLKEKLHKA